MAACSWPLRAMPPTSGLPKSGLYFTPAQIVTDPTDVTVAGSRNTSEWVCLSDQ